MKWKRDGNKLMGRENNYDLLRIVSTVAVIMIHVSATWFANAIYMVAEHGGGLKEIQSPFLICTYNALTRFAVPCFVILSGAFIIGNKKNAEYKSFYFKAFTHIGIPMILFSGLYVLYRLPACFIGEDRGVGLLLKDIIIGAPMYHMWYLYMLIGVYALAPIVIRFKDSVNEKSFYKVSLIFLILASFSRWTTENIRLNWDLGQSFEYLGYFMLGYSIRKIFTDKNDRKAGLFIAIGAFFEVCTAGLEYRQMIAGITEQELKYKIVSPYCPLIVLASICIFIGFTLIDVKKEYTNLSALTFYIYLIHAGVWDAMQKIIQFAGGNVTALNGAVWIPMFVVIVFTCSWVLSKLYLWIWNKLDKDKRVTCRLAKAVGMYAD